MAAHYSMWCIFVQEGVLGPVLQFSFSGIHNFGISTIAELVESTQVVSRLWNWFQVSHAFAQSDTLTANLNWPVATHSVRPWVSDTWQYYVIPMHSCICISDLGTCSSCCLSCSATSLSPWVSSEGYQCLWCRCSWLPRTWPWKDTAGAGEEFPLRMHNNLLCNQNLLRLPLGRDHPIQGSLYHKCCSNHLGRGTYQSYHTCGTSICPSEVIFSHTVTN